MKYLKLFESVENMTHNFFILFGSLIYIKDVDIFGSEWRLVMLNEKGEDNVYIGDRSDVLSDFIPTVQTFSMEFTKEERKPKAKNKPKIDKRYNIVYYEGNRKSETIRTNLESKLAYSLRGYFSKNPIYQRGVIKVELI